MSEILKDLEAIASLSDKSETFWVARGETSPKWAFIYIGEPTIDRSTICASTDGSCIGRINMDKLNKASEFFVNPGEKKEIKISLKNSE